MNANNGFVGYSVFDDISNYYAKYQQQKTNHPHYSECNHSVTEEMVIQTVQEYVDQAPANGSTEGSTKFGFWLPDLRLTPLGKHSLQAGTVEIFQSYIIYCEKRWTNAIIVLFYDGAVIGVMHKNVIYSSYNEMPRSGADCLARARIAFNILHGEECIYHMKYGYTNAEFKLYRNGKVSYDSGNDWDAEHHFSPKEFCKMSKLEHIIRDKTHRLAYQMFMRTPMAVLKTRDVEIL